MKGSYLDSLWFRLSECLRSPSCWPSWEALSSGKLAALSLDPRVAPSRPSSPEKFSVPHVCARFGPGGQLIKVIPNLPSEGQPALVEIHSMEVIPWGAVPCRHSAPPAPETCLQPVIFTFCVAAWKGDLRRCYSGSVLSSMFPPRSQYFVSKNFGGFCGSFPGSGRSPGEGNGTPLQYSCLENSMDRGAWGLQSMRSQRVRHDRSDLARMFYQHNWHISLTIEWVSQGKQYVLYFHIDC